MAIPVTTAALAKRFHTIGGDLDRRTERYSRNVLAPLGRRILAKHIRQTTKKRTGGLRTSPRTLVYRANAVVMTRLYSKHPGAGVLGSARSTTIRSKRPGGALAIPVNEALNPDGSARFPSPKRDTVELRLVVANGKARLVDEKGDTRWILVQSVTIKGRGFWPKTRAEWQRESARLYQAYVARLARGKL